MTKQQPRKGEVGQPTTNGGHWAETTKDPSGTPLAVEADGYADIQINVSEVQPFDYIYDDYAGEYWKVLNVSPGIGEQIITIDVGEKNNTDEIDTMKVRNGATVDVRRPTTPELAWVTPAGFIDENLPAMAVPDGAYILDEGVADVYSKIDGEPFTDYNAGTTTFAVGDDGRLLIVDKDYLVSIRRPKTEAEILRDEAAAKEREKRESFERSDTDGAASQWASGLAAERKRLEAQIVEQGGTHEFPALFDLDGNLVPAKLVSTRYGMSWAVLADPDDPHGEITDWIGESKARKADQRRKTMEKKGYREGVVRAPAKVKTAGSGTGMSGALSVNHYIGRADDGFSRDVEIVSTDDPGRDY